MAHYCIGNPCWICYPQLRPSQVNEGLMQSIEVKVNAGVAVIIHDDDGHILMGKRKGSHGAGTWSFPGGWIRSADDDIETAAKREVQEETGLLIDGIDVLDAMLTHFEDVDRHSVTVLVMARAFSGIPAVMEPDKLDGEWQWVDPKSMPEPLFKPLYGSRFITVLRGA